MLIMTKKADVLENKLDVVTKLLDRNSLLKKEEVQIEKVDLGNGEYVFVRQMSGREKDSFEQSLLKEIKDKDGNVTGYDRTMIDYRAKVAVITLCDENGVALLKPDDYEMLSVNMSGRRLCKIADAAQKLNAIDEESKEKLVKNSEGDQVANSLSDSASK